MKRIALLILAISFAIPSAHADDASKRAKILQLLAVVHLDRNLQVAVGNLLQQVNDMSRKQLPPTDLNVAQQKKLAALQQSLYEVVTKELNWAKFEPEYIKIYGDAYTEEELDGILAFYKTPAGQALLTKLPEITTKSVQLSQERLKLIQPQLNQLMQDFKNDVGTPAPATTK